MEENRLKKKTFSACVNLTNASYDDCDADGSFQPQISTKILRNIFGKAVNYFQ